MRTRCYPILSSPAFLLLVVSGRCMLHGAEGDSALTPDQRAGFWEAASEGNGAKASLYLELQIAKDISNVRTPTEAISGYFQEPSGRNCTFNSEDATLNKTHLLLQCLAHEGEVFVPGGRHLDITFARDGKSAAATWYEPDEILSLTLRRPSFDAGNSPLIGEWVAGRVAQTCVLHVFARTKPDPMLDLIDPLKLLVSLDIFSSGGVRTVETCVGWTTDQRMGSLSSVLKVLVRRCSLDTWAKRGSVLRVAGREGPSAATFSNVRNKSGPFLLGSRALVPDCELASQRRPQCEERKAEDNYTTGQSQTRLTSEGHWPGQSKRQIE